LASHHDSAYPSWHQSQTHSGFWVSGQNANGNWAAGLAATAGQGALSPGGFLSPLVRDLICLGFLERCSPKLADFWGRLSSVLNVAGSSSIAGSTSFSGALPGRPTSFRCRLDPAVSADARRVRRDPQPSGAGDRQKGEQICRKTESAATPVARNLAPSVPKPETRIPAAVYLQGKPADLPLAGAEGGGASSSPKGRPARQHRCGSQAVLET